MDFIHPDEKARFVRFAKDYTTAYILSNGMSYLRGSKRPRQSMDLSQSSTLSAESALAMIHHNHEMVDRKRAPPDRYRLHAAKYLQMDKMLKHMFFPLMTSQLKFGISSFTGCNLDNASDAITAIPPSTISDVLRTRGLYRGLCMFDVRTTDGNIDRSSQNGLNCATDQVGTVELTNPPGNSPVVRSHYRRFHSQPNFVDDSATDAARVSNAAPDLVNTDSPTQNTIRTLSLGSNLSDIEENAVAGMCYADPVVSQYRLRAISATSASKEGAANTELIAGENGPDVENGNLTWTGPDVNNYFTHMESATMRIVDGHVKLDIMNTEQTPCVVEIVIHSKKKNNVTKAQVMNQIFTDVNRHVRAKGVTDAPDNSANPSGGWQAFFDPSYPLLKVPSSGKSNQFVTEVHRSNHVLAPGQSKLVTIKLGSLWYKLGNKNDQIDDDLNLPAPQQIPKLKDNVGALYFSIGHSGFEYPQSVAALTGDTVTSASTAPGTAAQVITGTGFWVGKANAPSSISIDAEYEDKYYPTTFDRSPNNIINSGQPRPASLSGQNVNYPQYAVPLATIIPQRVASSGVVAGIADND